MAISAEQASWNLTRLRADSDRLAEVARLGGPMPRPDRPESAGSEPVQRGLDQAVPSCPGWTVEDVVRHVATVYLHKVEILRLGRLPEPWPPSDLGEREPVELFLQARDAVVEALERAGTELETWTFAPWDNTSGFWYRRMALETVVHRVDVELAREVVTPIDPELALDGIDELLTLMLGGPWWEEGDTAHPVNDTVRVTAAGRSWTIELTATAATVRPDAAGPVGAELFGEPEEIYLALWNRAEPPASNGSPETVREFLARLAEASQ